MGYLAQFEHDVFISYAHNDNAGSERWVSSFATDLKRALTQRLGAEPDIFLDERSLNGNEHLDDLTSKATGSAIFVPVVTPSYVARTWTMKEFDAFMKKGEDKRVFAIDILPLDRESDYPLGLRSLIRKPFWLRRSEGSVAITIDRVIDNELYKQLIATLAVAIKDKMVALKGATLPNAGAQPAKPVATILLAEVTPDLELEREKLRSYLQQFDIAVVPEGAYPGGGVDFAAAVQADCKRATHFVQLLGPLSERRPADLPEGYACHQYDAAVAAGLRPLLWHRPDIDRATIEVHRDLRLFQAPELRASGMEEFKSEVVRVVSEKKPEETGGGKPQQPAYIFVDSDKADLPLAKGLAAKIHAHKHSAYLPVFDGPPEDILEDLKGTIVNCSALVVVFGEAQPTWVRAQLQLNTKLQAFREGPPIKVLAVYTHLPGDKDRLNIFSSDIMWIDAHADHDQAIQDFLGKLNS